MSETVKKQEPGFTFRLYQSIKFDRQIDRKRDYISPGGYEILVNDNGRERTISFDFEESEGGVNEKNQYVADFVQKNPDYDTFPDLDILTPDMLRNITAVTEWFIYTGEPGETNLTPVEIINPYIQIIPMSGDTYEIPVTVKITPSSNC